MKNYLLAGLTLVLVMSMANTSEACFGWRRRCCGGCGYSSGGCGGGGCGYGSYGYYSGNAYNYSGYGSGGCSSCSSSYGGASYGGYANYAPSAYYGYGYSSYSYARPVVSSYTYAPAYSAPVMTYAPSTYAAPVVRYAAPSPYSYATTTSRSYYGYAGY